MADSARAAQEAAVRDLRELHRNAEGADRLRVALLLGLAIADLISPLPDTDPRVPELAREGLARLDESNATTADAARGRELLRGRMRSGRKPGETAAPPQAAGRGPEDTPEAETLRMGAADMSWNVDWPTLRTATAEGREVMEAMRLLLPSTTGPVQQFMAGGLDVFGAADTGQWTPENDRALAQMTQIAETTGVGADLLPFLQFLSMFVRLRRYVSAGGGEDHPDRPSLAEMDRIVAGLESEPDLVQGLGPPFSDFAGMSRFCAGFTLMARVWLDTRSGVRIGDPAWREGTIQRLERARDHLTEVPAAFTAAVQPMFAQIDGAITALKRAGGAAGPVIAEPVAPPPPRRSAESASPGRSPEPVGPRPNRAGPRPKPAAQKPSAKPASQKPGTAPQAEPAQAVPGPEAASAYLADAAAGRGDPQPSDPSIGQLSWGTMKGLRTLVQALPDNPRLTALRVMTHLGEATFFKRWTPEHDQALDELRQAVGQLAAEGEPERSDVVFARSVLALGRGLRWHHMSESPRPQENASPAELAAAIADIESVLEVVPRTAGLSADMGEEFAGLLHGQAGVLLRSLAELPDPAPTGPYEPADQRKARLLAQASDHLGKIPPKIMDQFPVMRDMTALARATGNDGGLGEASDRIADVYGELFDTSAGGLAGARAAATRARQTNDLNDITAAIAQARAVRRGLPPGHPQHPHALIVLAELLTQYARLTGNAHFLADGMDASIEAVRAALPEEPAPSVPGQDGPGAAAAGWLPAGHRAAVRAAAECLISLLGLNLAHGQRSGACHQIEPVLTAALAAAGPGDWPLRVALAVGIAAARSVCADAPPDEELRQHARQALVAGERMLPAAEQTDQWFDAAWAVYRWATIEAFTGHDGHGAAVALRMIDKLEGVLAGDPALAERVADRYVSAGVPAGLGGLRKTREQLLTRTDGGPRPEASEPSAAAPSGPPGAGQPVTATAGPPAGPPAEQAGLLARRGLDGLTSVLGVSPPGARHPPIPRDLPSAAPTLRAAAADLHAALAGTLADSDLRHRLDGALGVCLAELYWLGEADQPVAGGGAAPEESPAEGGPGTGAGPDALTRTLMDAIEHLNRCLSTSEHALPTVERADLLDVLARCYRELAPRGAEARAYAEQTARAALRELARCALAADDTERALDVAARATETVARAVGWCLADHRPRAAAEMAEAGRGLVLASVVLAGQVEQVLRGAGKQHVADAWRDGGEAGRLAGLTALWDTGRSGDLLRSPMVDQISIMLGGTAFDAIVYLVPATPPERAGPGAADPSGGPSGHALLLRPILGQIEVRDLPGLVTGTGTPVGEYLAALGTALETFDPGARAAGGFRDTPQGQAWADAVEKLGAWTYERVLGPLIDHLRGWDLGHTPHLALIPLGELAAIPYAAAWTSDPALPGARRYAVHDAVLSYAASARLLGEVARRPRQPLTERVVLVTDPAGDFFYTRRTARALAARQYPQAEVYGRKPAPNGLPTSAALLAALPREDAPGASLLHLCTHATTMPTARLQTADGWLPLTRILDQARNRPPDAAGGLIITNACLTDTARTHPDESLTLATAFLAAGATAVIGTRWPIDDDTAAVLTFRLHYHLQRGRSPAEALQLAQLDLIAPGPDVRLGLDPHLANLPDARLAHPATWAPYVHHGI